LGGNYLPKEQSVTEPTSENQNNKARRGSSLPSLVRDFEKEAAQYAQDLKDFAEECAKKLQRKAAKIQDAVRLQEATLQEERASFRAKVSTIIPGFERIVMVSKIAQEGDNKSFFRRLLGR
jgi:hypothetical protein